MCTAKNQFHSLVFADVSSNEHQILREIFQDECAISTVKLLQLAHQEHKRKGLFETGFLVFSPTSFSSVEKAPEAARILYFPFLEQLDLRKLKNQNGGQWLVAQEVLSPNNTLREWSYVYMTPGRIANQNDVYQEMASLIFSPLNQYVLISSNNLVMRGGLGSPLPAEFLAPLTIKQWQLVPLNNGYALHIPSISPSLPFSPELKELHADVRSTYKSLTNTVADPVDVVSGAFYVDELDLNLPGSFPLEIRRNYNSQNPVVGDFGCGWKLNLNPYLVEQDGKLYAAEADGTVIAYRQNQSRWEVLPEDNPDLCNFSKRGIGGTANPYHAYIENNVLYGTDGSKRFFEDGLLKKWIDCVGNTLTFSYKQGRLKEIESSNGDYCGLYYNHEGKISEIYSRDGRRITYDYDSRGDLVRVTLPNQAVIFYKYDKDHRITKETKPHGIVLENVYQDGKVKQQFSPMGPRQEMVVTATFDYQEGLTTVTDAAGARTTYKIFQKQIYKIIDPEGHETLQSWFIDAHTWFDPETESLVTWDQPGGWTRSLKSSTDKRGLVTSYLYDLQGNPSQIEITGDDLTGSGEKRMAKTAAYNAQNLCSLEETLNYKTVTIYDSRFTYLPKRIEKYCSDILLSYIESRIQ